MISILIVDDNSLKVKTIKEVLFLNPEIDQENVTTAVDIINAKVLLQENIYDLMILDISLPQRFGDNPDKDAGLNFLQELNLSSEYKYPFHIIGITAHEELMEQYKSDFQSYLWHLIYFQQQYSSWSDQLNRYVKYLLKSKYELKYSSSVKYDFDIAIVTALLKPELEQVLKLDGNWSSVKINNDHTNYHQGVFERGGKRLRVVAACADQMGLTAAAILCKKMIFHFRPKYLVMAGIAAGVRGKSNLGDILVSELAWDYGSGKIITKDNGDLAFKQDPRPIPASPDIRAMLDSEFLDPYIIPIIEKKWDNSNGFKIDSKLKLLPGPMASGSYVIENIKKVEEVIDQQRKLVGIDMESYAVFFAATHSTDPKPKPIVVKSVCDFGDSDKDDKFQTYASFTSANFIYEFCIKYLK
jgi:nucleoside phosphorylase